MTGLTTNSYTPSAVSEGAPSAKTEPPVDTADKKAPAVHNIVAMSPAAVRRLSDVAAEQGVELVGVRVGVSGGGCSGLSYVLDFEKEPRLGDQVFGEHPKIFVDRKSFVFLRGTTLDFEGGLNGKGFVFQNPNATSSCGCGSSFSA